jgi:hypothetical protein
MLKAKLATLLLLFAGLTVAVQAPAQAYTCTVDSWSQVGVDWLKVHTQPTVTSTAVGQVPYGSQFHYCSSSGRTAGGYWWVYGYGYNGSTKLTGWVVGSTPYLAHP